jgi:hypothetical protein
MQYTLPILTLGHLYCTTELLVRLYILPSYLVPLYPMVFVIERFHCSFMIYVYILAHSGIMSVSVCIGSEGTL